MVKFLSPVYRISAFNFTLKWIFKVRSVICVVLQYIRNGKENELAKLERPNATAQLYIFKTSSPQRLKSDIYNYTWKLYAISNHWIPTFFPHLLITLAWLRLPIAQCQPFYVHERLSKINKTNEQVLIYKPILFHLFMQKLKICTCM